MSLIAQAYTFRYRCQHRELARRAQKVFDYLIYKDQPGLLSLSYERSDDEYTFRFDARQPIEPQLIDRLIQALDSFQGFKLVSMTPHTTPANFGLLDYHQNQISWN